MNHPPSASGASPSRGRHLRPGEGGSAVAPEEGVRRVGFKPAVVAWSAAVALVFLLGGAWLAAGEFWFSPFADQDWEHGVFWLVFAFAGLYFVGVWVAAAIGRLRNGAVLAIGPDGIDHFALGRIAWSDLERVRLRQRRESGPHVLLAVFKLASAQPDLQLELFLKAPAYEEASSRLNTLDRIALMTAVSYYNAQRQVVLYCWALACGAGDLAQALKLHGTANRVRVEDRAMEPGAPQAGSAGQ